MTNDDIATAQPIAPALPPGRYWVAVLIGLAVTAFHVLHGVPLGHSVLMESFNWLFDFDTSRFVDDWCKPGIDGMPNVMDISFVSRHALSASTRPFCLAITHFVGDPGVALMVLTAAVVGCAAAVAYALAASFCAAEFDRVLLALGFAVSVHPLMLGVIPETYGHAMLGIGVHLALLARRGGRGLGGGAAAVFSLFLDLGFTVTNAGLNLLSSAVMAWRRMPLARWLKMEGRVWLIAGAALVLLTAVAALVFDPRLLGMAGKAPQRVWWIININRGEPASLLMVVCTFFVYSFVAPGFTVLDLPPPDGHPMLDFRHFEFSAVGSAALAVWALALLLSVVLAWRNRDTRRLLLIIAGWMLFNLTLHGYWQYRGSIYLYGAHTCFVLFALLAVGYGAALRRWPLTLVRGYATVLVALTAVNNFEIYRQMLAFVASQPVGR